MCKGIICSILVYLRAIELIIFAAMSPGPIARLQGLSEEEKISLSAVFKKRLLFRTGIFASMVLSCAAIMLFFNEYNTSYRVEDNLGVINVVFVVIAVVCGRMIVSEVMDYGKEIRSSNKKVIRTRIAGRKGDKIVLGNKSFARNEILLSCPDFDSFGAGDNVDIELSAVSNSIFSVKRS